MSNDSSKIPDSNKTLDSVKLSQKALLKEKAQQTTSSTIENKPTNLKQNIKLDATISNVQSNKSNPIHTETKSANNIKPAKNQNNQNIVPTLDKQPPSEKKVTAKDNQQTPILKEETGKNNSKNERKAPSSESKVDKPISKINNKEKITQNAEKPIGKDNKISSPPKSEKLDSSKLNIKSVNKESMKTQELKKTEPASKPTNKPEVLAKLENKKVEGKKSEAKEGIKIEEGKTTKDKSTTQTDNKVDTKNKNPKNIIKDATSDSSKLKQEKEQKGDKQKQKGGQKQLSEEQKKKIEELKQKAAERKKKEEAELKAKEEAEKKKAQDAKLKKIKEINKVAAPKDASNEKPPNTASTEKIIKETKPQAKTDNKLAEKANTEGLKASEKTKAPQVINKLEPNEECFKYEEQWVAQAKNAEAKYICK